MSSDKKTSVPLVPGRPNAPNVTVNVEVDGGKLSDHAPSNNNNNNKTKGNIDVWTN